MNIRVLVDPVGPLFDQPFCPTVTQITPDKIVFSSSGVLESERVKSIFETRILDVPLQIRVVNIGRSTETWTHNLAFGDSHDRQLRRKNIRVTNRLAVSDVGNNVCTTRQIEVCNHGFGTFECNGDLKYYKGQ